MFSRFTLSSLFIVFFACSPILQAEQLKIAVASNFYHSLQTLLKTSPSDQNDLAPMVLSSGSSGLLYAQIKSGAPFDVFLSADALRPELLEQQNLAKNGVTYAKGLLVLWPANNKVDIQLKQHKKKLVIANPKLAPYGIAAQQVLISLKLLQDYNQRLILANNVNQAFQFVDTKNAPLAILAKSQLLNAVDVFKTRKSSYLNYQVIPNQLYEPILQQAVILNRTKQQTASEQFMQWLLSPATQNRLVALGYGTIDD